MSYRRDTHSKKKTKRGTMLRRFKKRKDRERRIRRWKHVDANSINRGFLQAW